MPNSQSYNLNTLITTYTGQDPQGDMSGINEANSINGIKINVKYPFGTSLTPAKGDGLFTTDDSVAIQNIINYISANGGGSVVIPSGTFTIKQPLYGMPGVSIEGVDMQHTTLQWGGTTGGNILDISNVPLQGLSFKNIRFHKADQSGAVAVYGIWAGSTIANYNSGVARFENLMGDGIQSLLADTAVPGGVGIFDSLFINCWADHCNYGIWLHGSGNIMIHPRFVSNTVGLSLDYLDGESYTGVQVYGGVFVANNYDLNLPNVNGIRPCSFNGTWFEQSVYGLIDIQNVGTAIQSLSFNECMLSTNAVSPNHLLNFNNALGDIHITNSSILQTGPTYMIDIVQPSSANGRLTVTNTHVQHSDGTKTPVNMTAPVPACHVYSDMNQSIPNGANTVITFDQERFDTNAMHDNVTNNTRITCQTPGKYLITANVRFDANATGMRSLYLRLNGSTFIACQAINAIVQGAFSDIQVNTVYQLNAGDYVDVLVYQSSGAALNVLSLGNQSPEFSMVQIA